MSLVKGKNTTPELLAKKIVHGLGFRFRNKDYDLPGRPDIVLPKHRIAILVHGCFWHRHAICRGNRVPKSRVDYWARKLSRNVERDKEKIRALRRLGWKVVVLWECQLKDREATLIILRSRLSKSV